MERDVSSHKGDNGKVSVVGGSRRMHGAPLFAALSAEASGVDTVSICLPDCHEEVAKNTMLNAFVYTFESDDLAGNDVEMILELLATIDCAVIGPGIARTDESIEALHTIIAAATCPMVLDATALQTETLDLVRGKMAVLTPHLGELERMGLTKEDVSNAAADTGVTICVKGPVDLVVNPDGDETEIEGGNAGLTTGGTGDVLSGLIAGLIAQRMDITEACLTACETVKGAGNVLFEEKGYAYTAIDVVHEISGLLKD